MAEKEVKEVKKENEAFKINIWFILFLIYLILSATYIIKQNQKIEALNANVSNLNYQLENSINLSNTNTTATIVKLENLIKDLKATLPEEENNAPVVNDPVVIDPLVGVYTGSAETMQMVLSLVENNVASLKVTDESGESAFNGTYSSLESAVTFVSEDGLTTYSFTSLEDGSLKLVNDNVELTLSK